MMKLRRMEKEDLNIVMEIEQQCFSDPWTRQSFEESLENVQARFMTAEDGGHIIGYCCSYYAMEESEIINVAVAPQLYRKGCGFWMLQQFLDVEAAEGITRHILEVRKSNTAAQCMYKKAGFCSIGERRNFYTQPVEDAVIMVREKV